MSSTRRGGLFPLQLDFLAKRYRGWPSDLMKMDPVDLAFNLDVATLGLQEEIRANEEARAKMSGTGRHDAKAERDRIAEMIAKLPKGSLARKKWEESKRRALGGRIQ